METKKHLLFCDNGIVGHINTGGLGIIASAGVIINSNGEAIHEFCKIKENVTNNYGELRAILLGLIDSIELGIKEIIILSDSEIAVKCLNGEYAVKSEILKPIIQEIKELLNSFSSYEIRWICRDKNIYADYLTAIALQPYRKTPKKILGLEETKNKFKEIVAGIYGDLISQNEIKPLIEYSETEEEYRKRLNQEFIHNRLIDARIIKITALNDEFDESQADTWKYLTQKLLSRYSPFEVIDFIMDIYAGISDMQFKMNMPLLFYYDNGLIKEIKDKPEDIQTYKISSGVTGKIVAKIKISTLAEEYGFKVHGDKAICLFHNDTDPSLIFNDSKGTFKCWSSNCGKKGNIIDFVYECEQAGLVRSKE